MVEICLRFDACGIVTRVFERRRVAVEPRGHCLGVADVLAFVLQQCVPPAKQRLVAPTYLIVTRGRVRLPCPKESRRSRRASIVASLAEELREADPVRVDEGLVLVGVAAGHEYNLKAPRSACGWQFCELW